MRGILRIARGHLFTAFRERVTLFWFLIFPLFLLAILTLIFGNMGQEGEISFAISVVNLESDTAGPADFAAIVESVFKETGKAPEEGKEPLFTLTRPSGGEDLEEFLAREKEALRLGRRAAVIVIPEGFNQELLERMMRSGSSPSENGALTIFINEGSAASEMATSIIEQILSGIDRQFLAHVGRFQEEQAIPSETLWVGSGGEELSYVDFLLPGVILMGFFVNGLFGVPGSILFARDRRVLCRYWVTPLTVPRYLAGFSLGHLTLCLIQFALIFMLARFAFRATITFAQPMPVLFLLLGAITFLTFGFFIASLAKTANAGMAIANILNMPMMFLGGLFFPIAGLPTLLKVIVYANPVTYLAEGLRMSLGIQGETFSIPLTLAVPVGWIAFCIFVASKRLSWDVKR
ncbi:ABC transporter permease [Candidatus Bipolaricaulota bacterium]|nr:ABC transporter permease [Candidatus Bipolaricaulota bacterium]